MAKGEVVDFLKKYYRILHTGAMDYDVLARLVDNKKKGLLTAEQESWFNEGFIIADKDPKNPLKYRAADELLLTDTSELHEDELKKLYIRIAKAMYGMKSASGVWGAKDQSVKDFVNKYVEDLQLFPIPTATTDCETSITALLNLLDPTGKTPEEQKLINSIKQRIVTTAKKSADKQEFTDVAALDKFIKEKLLTKKYNSDISVQTKLKEIANGLYDDWRFSNNQDKVTTAVSEITEQLSIITQDDAFGINSSAINTDKLDKFSGGYGAEILQRVYTDKDVRAKFAEKDQALVDIVTNNAEGKISYQDPNSENYVAPKTDDVLTPIQQIEKWATDSYNNTFRKYSRLRGDPMLFSGFSKEIFKAIDKAKIKPTDGLNGLLEKVNDIKKNITNKTVSAHFDWFVETMNGINSKYSKAVAGSWNNAEQMKCVIREIILKATSPKATEDDMEMAKTAMEIMTAMKYGMMTSKIMDALTEGTKDFSLFSDGNLSWNKNEGIKFVTTAFDKSIRAAFLGVGYGVTFVKNKIMMRNMQFDKEYNNNDPALAARIAKEEARIKSTRKNIETQIKGKEAILQDLNTKGVNATTINQRRSDAEQQKQNLDAKGKELEAKKKTTELYQQKHEDFVKNQSIIDEYKNLNTTIAQLKQDQKDKKDELIKLRTEINDPNTYIDPITNLPMGDFEKQQKQEELTKNLKELEAEYNNITDELTENQNKQTPTYYQNIVVPAGNNLKNLQPYENSYNNAVKDYNATKTQYENMETNYNELNDRVSQFTKATDAIKELNESINNRNTALKTWPYPNRNKVLELEDFWNFLQTGKAKTWRLFTNKAQERFDTNKEIWLQEHISQHGMAA